MNDILVQYNVALISACSAITGAIIGAVASLLSAWVSRKVTESGKIEVFGRFVYSKASQQGFGIHDSSDGNGHILVVPMWVELANTAPSAKYIRDLNVIAYNQNELVSNLTQIQGANIGKDSEEEYGNHQSYSFVVDGKTIQKYDVLFFLKELELPDDKRLFNRLTLRYYDEKGKAIEKVIYSSEMPIEWTNKAFDYKREWIEISG